MRKENKMENKKDILSRLNRCFALLGVVTCDLTRSGANTEALQAVHDLLGGICEDFNADAEFSDI